MQEFIVDAEGPPGTFAVFEDDGETGYLYVYSAMSGITRHLHIYNRSAELDVRAEDVLVVWSQDHAKCGVVIWGQMRGIIDVTRNTEGRVRLTSREAHGISDPTWLSGFPKRNQKQ